MDMEAGLEHLGPGHGSQHGPVHRGGRARRAQRSRPTHNVKRLAAGPGRHAAFGWWPTRCGTSGDEEFVRSAIPADDFLGCIHYNPEIMDADRQGKSPYDFSPAAIEEIRKIKAILDRD